MKYLFMLLLLPVSPPTLADLQYMSQQMTEMKNVHERRIRQEQQSQQERIRYYLQEKHEQEQNAINRHHRRQYRTINLVNRLE
ncbi:MAG: hypothetical protein ACXWE9_07735 [Methylobacter sp.]